MPFAVVGSDKEYQVNGKRVLGRKTAWGVVEGEWAEVFAVLFFFLTQISKIKNGLLVSLCQEYLFLFD